MHCISRSGATGCASLVLCCLLATAGKAWYPWSTPQEPYQGLMPPPWECEGLGGPALEQADRVSATLSFSLHPDLFESLRLYRAPYNMISTGLYHVAGEYLTINVKTKGERRSVMPHLRVALHPFTELEYYKLVLPGSRALDEGERRYWDWRSGLIYIESTTPGTDSFEISIAGAVRAPWFKLGRDSLAQWQESIRHAPAPWAELEGDYSILTLPSGMIRDLDDPRPLIRFYDQLVKDVNTLVGLSTCAPDKRDRAPDLPVRFVMDHFFHSRTLAATAGYPIRLNWIYHKDPFVWLTPEEPRARSILTHELGHNYEPDHHWFEPPGASEAFANLVDYGCQSMKGISPLGTRAGWPHWWPDYYCAYYPVPGALLALISSWWRGDSRIWVEGPYTAWTQKQAFMITLVRNLSHEFIARLYSRFRHTPQEALPWHGNRQQRTDFFFELLCDVTHQDLTRFFHDWRVPVSLAACLRVANKGYKPASW